MLQYTGGEVFMNHISKSQRGSMLVQVLISAGMMSAMALTMAQLFLQQNRQIKHLEQKSETIDIKNEIFMLLSDPVVCGCNLNPANLTPTPGAALTFNGTQANTSLNLTATGIRSSCDSGVPAHLTTTKRFISNLKINSIQVKEINPTSNNTRFTGRVEVGFSEETTMLKFRNISLPIEISTQQAAGAVNTVATCKVSADVDASKNCIQLGGTYNSTTNKCSLSDPIGDCEALGGTYDPNATPQCTLPSNPQTDCAALGGSFNSLTGKCSLDANTNCTALGGTIVSGKCQISSPTPTSTTDCSTTYGNGWVFDSRLRTCVPPGKHQAGDVAGRCVSGGITQPEAIYPALHDRFRRCTCATGYTTFPLSIGDPEASGAAAQSVFSCTKDTD